MYAKIFHSLIKKTPAHDRSAAIKAFAQLLSDNDDIKKSDEIIYAIEKYLYQQDGEKKMSKVDKKKDPSIMGGIKIQMGDMVVDNSVRTRMNQLKNAFK